MADLRDDTWQRVVVHARAGDEEPGQVKLLEPAGTALDSPERLRVRLHFRKAVVVLGAQENAVISIGMKVDEGTASHVDAKTGKGKVVDRGAAVVPDAKLLERRTP